MTDTANIPIKRLLVLDHGFIEYLDHMGTDLKVVQAAQASFDRASTEYGERERRILRSLMREEHGTPFEHIAMTVRIKLPIFLARQFVKHRLSSWSEHSGRYSVLEPEFYVPPVQDVRRQSGKAMEYRYERMPEHLATGFVQDVRELTVRAFAMYQRALDGGVAKEQARYLLPVNTYTTVVWTINARSLFNFLRLRLDSHAQAEARAYAERLEMIAFQLWPDTMAAFRESLGSESASAAEQAA